MRPLVYALRFRGHATWAGADGNVRKTAASAPGRYLAVCIAPFGTGYPHGIDGMNHFFNVA